MFLPLETRLLGGEPDTEDLKVTVKTTCHVSVRERKVSLPCDYFLLPKLLALVLNTSMFCLLDDWS